MAIMKVPSFERAPTVAVSSSLEAPIVYKTLGTTGGHTADGILARWAFRTRGLHSRADNVLAYAFILVQHLLTAVTFSVRWDRKPVNNEVSLVGISLIANALRSYVHLATSGIMVSGT